MQEKDPEKTKHQDQRHKNVDYTIVANDQLYCNMSPDWLGHPVYVCPPSNLTQHPRSQNDTHLKIC